MIFKYKDLQISREVELDILKIRQHQECAIRTANLQPDGTLYYNETIDNSLIELIPETVPEEKLLLGEVSANNFYYDVGRDRYLGLDTVEYSFYQSGTNKKNMYMFSTPNISSASVPYRLFDEMLIIGYQWFTGNNINNGTTIMEVRDMNNGAANILSITNNTGWAVSEGFNDIMSLVVPAGARLAAYILNTRLSNPVLTIYLKKTYYPV